MTIQEIIEAKNNPPKSFKALKTLLVGTAFTVIQAGSNDFHLLCNPYQRDENNNSNIRTSETLHDLFSQILQIAIVLNKKETSDYFCHNDLCEYHVPIYENQRILNIIENDEFKDIFRNSAYYSYKNDIAYFCDRCVNVLKIVNP